MYPELIHFGSFALPTYGFLMAAGFLTALFLLRKRAASFGLTADDAVDLGVWVLLAGLVGAKLLLLIVEWKRFHLLEARSLMELLRSGGVFYGGLIGAVLAAFVFLRLRRIDFWAVADAAAPSIALGQSIGRLGCFAAGCCWGKECHLPWAITFTSEVAEHNVGVPLGVPLHPTQLYEAVGTLLLCGLLLFFERRRFSGETFARYVVGYALLRGTIEIFRGDPRGQVLGLLSTSQFIALCGLLLGAAIFAWRRKIPSASAAA
jgi:phosphatidylglycerol---prolipoprotein diacylglyceryl transferase